MINLLPVEEKKRITQVFYFRLLVLFSATLGLSIFVGILALVPVYLTIAAKNTSIEQKIALQKSEALPAFNEQTLAFVKDLNLKVALIENGQKNQFIVSQKVINAVMAHQLPGIKLTAFTYDHDSLKGKKVTIQGIAPTRETLLAFRLALEQDKLFKQVDLPISNFIKGSNIQFSLNLIPS